MAQVNNRAMLAANQQAEVRNALVQSEEYLAPENIQTNVVGMGAGIKWSNGEPTGEPALVVLVQQKLEREMLTEADLVPETLGGMQTDVLAIGYPIAGRNPLMVGAQTLAQRLRPAEGGYSVGQIAGLYNAL